ncbi:MAG TPA: adenine phosphoribosyltransferase [Mycobacteriales bacterium]|nr:adenine phosphoribosyltransferase [Mycobacteriales bacterium]
MSDISEVVAQHVRDIPDFPSPGILFKDITPLLADGPAFAATVDAMRIGEFDVVAGIEARGFLIGAAIAYAAGVGIVPIRKAGKLPSAALSTQYELEYGTATIEMHTDAIAPGQRVLVVDDVLATGGTLAATLTLLGQVDARIAGVAVILELAALGGRERVTGLGYEPTALLSV